MSRLIIFVFVLVTVAYVLPKTYRPNIKIVGGNDTDIGLHPWQVSIRWDGVHWCGGSIISDRWVVTAAHCSNDPEHVSVIVGSTFRSTGGEKYNINRIIIHDDFETDFNYDIALVELTEVVNNPNASVIDLPTQDEKLAAGTNMTVTGWGDTEYDGAESEVLQEVVVPIVSLENCANAYQADSFPDQILCAGYLGIGGKDACQGDSGGPGVADGKLFGLVSRGIGCAEPDYPGIYTNVANFVSWIKNNTGI